MKVPLFSIVIPYFNKEKTIIRAINSVIEQTFNDWELILIDDCSNQRLDNVLLPNDIRILNFRNEFNLGAAKTRQRGMDFARGEFISFLDADDWWDNDFLELCYTKLIEYKHSDGAYVKTLIHFGNGKTQLRQNCEMGLFKVLETLIEYARPWQTGGILWRKSSCGDWGDLKTNEDSWFEVTSAKFNILIPVNKVAYFVDLSGDNHLSSTYNRCSVEKDKFLLFKELYIRNLKRLNFKYKIILYNRMIRSYLKILEYCNQNTCKNDIKFISDSFIFPVIIFRSEALLRLIHRFLQCTPYKIKF
jgi:glycosyltransferase involved in cell wall biosynthesis